MLVTFKTQSVIAPHKPYGACVTDFQCLLKIVTKAFSLPQ